MLHKKAMDSSKRRPSIIRHPLRDPVILERIFRCLPVEDLKACRMTLKLWHEPATLLLTEKISGILLHEKTEWRKFLKTFTKSCTSTKLSGLSHIHPFHSFIFYGCYPEDPSWTPYKSAILDYMHAKVKLPKKTVWEEKFFTTFGLQVLELRYCQFNFLNTERSLREFREMISTNCPNLSALTLEFQKEQTTHTRNNSTAGTPTPSPSPTPSASPSPQMPGISNASNVFFPPNEDSLRKSMDNLKRFVFRTDNKCWVNPNALEEFMSFMPSLEEFTYRYTGAKKQWAFVRRVDVIDIICNLIQCGSFSNLKVLDLDSKGTVLSGEDFRKLSVGLLDTKDGNEAISSQLQKPSSSSSSSSPSLPPPSSENKPELLSTSPRSTIQLTRFSSQVFIKSEQDWENFCNWLSKFNLSLKEIDIQVRSHFSQLPAEEQIPTLFPKVTTATLLLDNNFQVFLRRMPNVKKFCGVYDNELLPFCSATQNLSLDGGMVTPGSNNNGSSSPSSVDGNNEAFVNNSYYQYRRRSSKRSGVVRTWSIRSTRSRSKSVEDGPGTPGSAIGAAGETSATSSPAKIQQEAATKARYLRIFSNEESMLDIEWKAGLFQYVTSLETDIYFDQDLRLIWTHLHNVLDELILHLKTLIPEQAFTGAGVQAITFHDLCRSQSKSGKGKDKDTSSIGEKDYHDDDYLVALDEYPNLGMMKNLRIFEVHTAGRQDAFGSQFSASIIIFGVSLLPQLERLVLPPAIPPKCLENSISYIGKLTQLRYVAVCDDTFQSVLPFHVLKCAIPELEIVVKYYQNDIKRTLCNPWRVERLIFPDFLPEHRSTSLGGNGGNSFGTSGTSTSSGRSRFHLSKQCSAP